MIFNAEQFVKKKWLLSLQNWKTSDDEAQAYWTLTICDITKPVELKNITEVSLGMEMENVMSAKINRKRIWPKNGYAVTEAGGLVAADDVNRQRM